MADHGTVPRMERTSVGKLCWLTSIAFILSLVYSPALWNPPKIVSIFKLLYGDFRSKVICGQYLTAFWNKDRSQTRMHITPIALVPWDRLGHERNNIRNKSWHQVDLHRYTGWSRFCGWHMSSVTPLWRHPKQKREHCQKCWKNLNKDKHQQHKGTAEQHSTADPFKMGGHINEEVT